MHYEQILRRDDGTKIKIIITVYFMNSNAKYNVHVSSCNKGKRKYNHCGEIDTWDFRHLSMPERREEVYNEYLKVVSQDEIHTAKLACWELIKISTKPSNVDNF